MIYTIKNDFLTVKIADFGAELKSVISNKTGFEYMWQADEKIWGQTAPVIFPTCGRLFDKRYTYKGISYPMPIHGFVPVTTFTLKEQNEQEISFSLLSNEQTKKSYPFDFELIITYTLDKNSVKQTYKVINLGSEDLPFAYGGHPGFTVPLLEGKTLFDHKVTFGKKVKRNILGLNNDTGLCTGKDEPYSLIDDCTLAFNEHTFDVDSIFLESTEDTATLTCEGTNRKVEVKYSGMTHLGFWQEPGAGYICIEPWCGVPGKDGEIEDFANRKLFNYLAPNKQFENCFIMTFTD